MMLNCGLNAGEDGLRNWCKRKMAYLNQLLSLLMSPIGFIGVAIGLLFVTVLYQEKYRPLHWFLVALMGFASSLAEFRDQWTLEPPALVFPLQQIRAQGRPLTIVLLGLLLVIIFQSKGGRDRGLIPSALPYLFFIQGLVFLKTATEGSLNFAILAALTFGGLMVAMLQGPSRWLETEIDYKWGVATIAMVGIIFAVVNAYQGAINLYPITFTHGRLLGTTGNPQHAATLLAATVPAFLYLVEEEKDRPWLKVIWIAFLGVIFLGLAMTGSRTGVGTAVIGVMLFYGFSGKIITRAILAVGVLFLVTIFFEPAQQWFLDTVGSSNLDRFDDLSLDTREGVWRGQWRTFTNYPIFGAPLRGSRLGYGENSWLATGASFGLIGFIPLLLFGWECLKMMFQLYQYGKRQPIHQQQCNLVIAGLLSLLVGSFFEGYLLGNLTFSLMAIVQYLILGNFLLQRQRQEKWEQAAMLYGASSYS